MDAHWLGMTTSSSKAMPFPYSLLKQRIDSEIAARLTHILTFLVGVFQTILSLEGFR
jgi:hypothetical protein